MLKLIPLVIVGLLSVAPGYAAVEDTWTDVPLIDAVCTLKVKGAPDAHTRDCALQCHASGYGIVDASGEYLPFDDPGNAQALAALKSSRKADHLRVTVTGERKGGKLAVRSLVLR